MKRTIITLLCVLLGFSMAHAGDCEPSPEPTFTVNLPKLGAPPNPLNWDLPAVWAGHPGADDDSIEVPNGRPTYALIVSGYANNAYLDQLMVYEFARHLMDQGAYVHWAWWNNLLAPYMERPLHYGQSHPGTASDIANFATPGAAEDKAVPGENYQFLADAKLLLSAIREHNPEAVIILVGHSMGGHSVAQLANESNVMIDLVAPVDPVWSRTYPWVGAAFQNADHYNWTRYRATRETFNGYRSMEWEFGNGCVPFGPWKQTYAQAAAGSGALCSGMVHVHGAPRMTFGGNVINLYHRWQHEAKFPYDFEDTRLFNPDFPNPPGGSEVQLAVSTQSGGTEDGGWPLAGLPANSCCPNFDGVGWPDDGHGEIIGARGPVPPAPKPLAFRVKTSPECGNGCDNLIWPARTFSSGNWSNPNANQRVAYLQALESLPLEDTWEHEPYNPALCLVSQALINRFESINKPPVADAGNDQIVECNGCDSAMVTLDGSGSSDPDDDNLQYTWTSAHDGAAGESATLELSVGVHCITLEVEDSVGHVAFDTLRVTVDDSASPVTPYTRLANVWLKDAGSSEAFAFDEDFPGIANGAGCLLEPPLEPAVISLSEGTVTVSASLDDQPYCAVTDAGTTPAVSDARHQDDGIVTFDFDPPITAFYTYFGSLPPGDIATMHLYSDTRGTLVDIIASDPSTHNVLAAGMGFTSTVAIKRIEFAATGPSSFIIGAFVGLLPDEPSLGTVDLGDYAGPDGSGVIELDFAVTFGPPADKCPADVTDDGFVDVQDLLAMLGNWGPCSDCPADINHDDVIDINDLLIVLGGWGACE